MARARPRPGPPPDDRLYRTRLTYRQNRAELHFDVAEGLFSATRIDAGTAFLLRWLGSSDFQDVESVLDLGCGYGPIGLTLAAFDDRRTVLCVDRDALAVEYTAWNAALNGLADRVQARGGVGYADLDAGARFDLVTSNIPAKVGPEALEHFLLGGAAHLTPGGRMAVVVIDRLRDMVERTLDRPGIELLERHDNRGYAVFVYRPPGSVDARGWEAIDPYRRGEPRPFAFRRAQWSVTPTFTLPEFDTLSYGTQEAMKLLDGVTAPEHLVAGVGHGHLAAYVFATQPGARLDLVDRDLLALRVATDTLTRSFGSERVADAVRARHASRPTGAEPVARASVLLHLDQREPVAITTATTRALFDERAAPGPVLLYGRSADTSRTVENLRRQRPRIKVTNESRSRGHAAVVLEAS
jgi:16S rRNA G1207 methylase RsmC